MIQIQRIDELELENAYQDWQEQLYLNADQDAIDKLEDSYYEIFQKVSAQTDFWTHGLTI